MDIMSEWFKEAGKVVDPTDSQEMLWALVRFVRTMEHKRLTGKERKAVDTIVGQIIGDNAREF